MGVAMKRDMITKTANSFDNKPHTLNTVAPNTLRTPISFVLCSATKVARPNNPKQEIRIANTAKNPDSLLIRSSTANFNA